MLKNLLHDLEKARDLKQAKILQRFFKTGEGEYGKGDVFLGIRVPVQREIAKKYYSLKLGDLQKLLESKIHEHRLVALIILVEKFSKEPSSKIFKFYIKNATRINNWDLVDISAPKIVGAYLIGKEKKILYELAESSNLWKKRIAIVSTFTFIRSGEFSDCIKISEILLKDKHDLIHKAVGWMLREVGKKNKKTLERFLEKNYAAIPRTTLRYAIERFPEAERKSWLIRNK